MNRGEIGINQITRQEKIDDLNRLHRTVKILQWLHVPFSGCCKPHSPDLVHFCMY